MAWSIISGAIRPLMNAGLRGQEANAPSKLPRANAISVVTTSRPIVQGNAVRIKSSTVTGKRVSDGPRSPRNTPPMYSTYCSSSGLFRPNFTS
jgi:hypothetical protein